MIIKYIPSISSTVRHKNSPLEFLNLLVDINYPYFLISAFDIYTILQAKKENELNKVLENARSNYQNIYLDSGIYEKKRLKSKDFEWDAEKYDSIIDYYNFNIKFIYDEYNFNTNKENIISNIKLFMDKSKYSKCNPIIHSNIIEDFPYLVYEISKSYKPLVIAIPDRELGDSIFDVSKNIFKIKRFLKEKSCDQNLHILGTGNPISILLYSYCGANSFDGLEWYQIVVDYKTATMHHSKHYSFYSENETEQNTKSNYLLNMILHNLNFYTTWLEDINKRLNNDTINELLEKYIPNNCYDKFLKNLKELN